MGMEMSLLCFTSTVSRMVKMLCVYRAWLRECLQLVLSSFACANAGQMTLRDPMDPRFLGAASIKGALVLSCDYQVVRHLLHYLFELDIRMSPCALLKSAMQLGGLRMTPTPFFRGLIAILDR